MYFIRHSVPFLPEKIEFCLKMIANCKMPVFGAIPHRY